MALVEVTGDPPALGPTLAAPRMIAHTSLKFFLLLAPGHFLPRTLLPLGLFKGPSSSLSSGFCVYLHWFPE